jgi:16S rRNA (guanine966-N2)-methyltransferase
MARKSKLSVRRKPAPSRRDDASDASPAVLRIIGGTHRGRKLTYHGDPRTRPMKDRVREAVFNLVGPAVKGKHALDLFAGTGSIGLEALSRGAARATFLERHFPTAEIIRQNAAALELSNRAEVIPGDAFAWIKRLVRDPRPAEPWLVFISPNWDLFVEQPEEMMQLVSRLMGHAAPDSMFIVEADQRFDMNRLPPDPQGIGEWDIREYPPAVIGILRT